MTVKMDVLLPYIEDINKMVSKRWTFRILMEMRTVKNIRYNELLDSMGGISPTTLSSTLKHLQEKKLIKRSSFGDNPPYRVEYSLTKRGIDFVIATYPLIKWAIQEKPMAGILPN